LVVVRLEREQSRRWRSRSGQVFHGLSSGSPFVAAAYAFGETSVGFPVISVVGWVFDGTDEC
jgi:hypothetical protein